MRGLIRASSEFEQSPFFRIAWELGYSECFNDTESGNLILVKSNGEEKVLDANKQYDLLCGLNYSSQVIFNENEEVVGIYTWYNKNDGSDGKLREFMSN
tara:strand:+ start:655 stop:951 length:297 start_codon:yes stop_codon:yes gene_type:complete